MIHPLPNICTDQLLNSIEIVQHKRLTQNLILQGINKFTLLQLLTICTPLKGEFLVLSSYDRIATQK